MRCLWCAVPRDDLWTIVFADDVAAALRNIFRDLRIVRRALDVVSVATGLRRNPRKSVIVNYTRRPHMFVQDSASKGSGLPAHGLGRYLGFVLGQRSFAERWATVRAEFLARAAHVKASGVHSCGTPLAYNSFAVSLVLYNAQ